MGRRRGEKRMRGWLYDLAHPCLRLLIRIVRGMSRPTALALGARLGDLAFHLLRSRRRIALRNIAIAFGDRLSKGDRYRLARRAFRHLGMNTIEFLRFDDLDAGYFERHVELEGVEHVRAAFAAGKGVLAISAHLGHFHLIPAAVNRLGLGRCLVVGRPIASGGVNAEFQRLREAAGIWTLPPRNAVMAIFLALRRNDAVGMVLDQNIGWARAVFVDFFGKAAATSPGAAMVAGRWPATVLGCYTYRRPDGGHRIVFTPPIPYVQADDPTEAIRLNTARYTRMIESWVRRHPEQWFWVHRRWRTRPREEWGEPGVYDG